MLCNEFSMLLNSFVHFTIPAKFHYFQVLHSCINLTKLSIIFHTASLHRITFNICDPQDFEYLTSLVCVCLLYKNYLKKFLQLVSTLKTESNKQFTIHLKHVHKEQDSKDSLSLKIASINFMLNSCMMLGILSCILHTDDFKGCLTRNILTLFNLLSTEYSRVIKYELSHWYYQ